MIKESWIWKQLSPMKRQYKMSANPPAPIPPNPKLEDEEEIETYFGLANELGLDNSALEYEKLCQILKEFNQFFYNWKAMLIYLEELTNETWALYPVRTIDSHVVGYSHPALKENRTIKYLTKPYEYRIPLHILELMKNISNAMPTAKFYINSDEKNLCYNNSFLFVLLPSVKNTYVCAYWQEQKF